MAFENERVPDEEKKNFTFEVKTYADGTKPTLSWWTVDRDRNAFLVKQDAVGGGRDGPDSLIEYYVLGWNGQFVYFSAHPQRSGTLATGVKVNWRVLDLTIPSELKEKREDVVQLIRQALDAMGWLYERSYLASVTVDFDVSSGL